MPKARLSGALLEAVRWWNRSEDAFPPPSVALASCGGLLELTLSGHAAGEPPAPNKLPGHFKSALWDLPHQDRCPLSREVSLKAALWSWSSSVRFLKGQTRLKAFSLTLGNQGPQ